MESKQPYYIVPEPDFVEPAINTAGRTEEAALLAACLRRPQLFDELREIIKPEQFSWIAYSQAWAAMTALKDGGDAIDSLTVGDVLERGGMLDSFMPHDTRAYTGRAALSFIREQGQPQNARTYAETVQDYAAKRQLMTIASQLATWSANGRRAVDILADTEKRLMAVQTGGGKAAKYTATIKEATAKAYDRTDKASRGLITFTPTGYPKLDEIVTGFTAPDLWIVAARPGMGKTAFMASVAWNAVQTGKRIAFFTLEMGMEQIAMRFISMISGVSYSKQLTGKLADHEWEAYNAAIETLDNGELGLILNDMPAISPNKIRQELRKMGKIDLVIVDYIQLASADTRQEIRNQEVAAITKALKEICKEFDVPVMAAAQLNRAAGARAQDDKRPVLTDLAESDELGKSADKVLFIHGDIASSEREIIVAKQRNGPAGLCKLDYIGYKTLFKSQGGI